MSFWTIDQEALKKKVDEARALFKQFEELNLIEWHSCGPKHGAIRAHARLDNPSKIQVEQMLITFYGEKGIWVNKFGIEFYDNTSVYPPGKRPWNWCGTSILFEEWRLREEQNYQAGLNFQLGDKVSFEHKGEVIVGRVSNIGKRVTVIIPNGTWYVPARELTLVERGDI